MTRIFVSYRRGDAGGYAGRLYDHLVGRYGEDAAFKDVDSLEPGADFAEVIARTIPACDAVIAVIGPKWLGAGTDGRSRVMNPSDWVRVELATAFERDVRVIPVLVDGAGMPTESQLPEDLHPLARRHAVELTESIWRPQVEQLLSSLDAALVPQGAWTGSCVRSGAHSRTVRLQRHGEDHVLEFKVQWYIGMAQVDVDGETLWRGAANATAIPRLSWRPQGTDGPVVEVRLERDRTPAVNTLQGIRIALDGAVVYDELP